MDIKDKIRIIKAIDFGSIDGLNDKHLSSYFIDKNYWSKIVNGKEFFIIGRKGTGKSAIYTWIHEQQYKQGVLIENLSFKNFPFEKLLKLSDDDFSKPNQYQSIWRNIILSEIAAQIIKDQLTKTDEEYQELERYVKYRFGTDLTELHQKVTTTTKKSEGGLKFEFLNLGKSSAKEISLGDGLENITTINKRLEQLIRSYLKRNKTRKYVIQFDQLDDNYTSFINNKAYFQCIISLFKAIYDLNISFDYEGINVKIVAYLRSDIYYEINTYDPDSARWDDHKFLLNWSIINKRDWVNPPLLQLINKRILASTKSINEKSPFHFLFNDNDLAILDEGFKMKPFKYIVHRTFHRPRDIVQFCKYIQKEVKDTDQLDYRTIFNAEKKYSDWLLGEISNEIGPQIRYTKTLYAFLRTLGSRPFDKKYFVSQFLKGRNKNIEKSPQALMRFLYRLGVIMNINEINGQREFYSIIRNERTELDERLKMMLHSGIIKGLHTYEYED
jgi:hypothetical protein